MGAESQPDVGDRTSATLLVRLRERQPDETSWREFVERYQRRILNHCRACGLQPADAEDVTQAVLLRLVDKLRRFEYDPSRRFRAWLRTVTNNVVADFISERRGPCGSGDSQIVKLLENVAARDGFASEIEAEFDRELLEEALVRVRNRVPPQQWEAFRLTALEGLSGAEAGQQLDMLVATVYTAKSKVQKLVRETIEQLEQP